MKSKHTEANALKKFGKPLSTTVWCIILLVISVIVLLITPKNSPAYDVILACTTGISASAVVTLFAERANEKKQKRLVAVRLADFHVLIDRCCIKNVPDDRRREVVDDTEFWNAAYSEYRKERQPYFPTSYAEGSEEYKGYQEYIEGRNKKEERIRQNCILSMVILTKELDRLRSGFRDVDLNCLTQRELNWVINVRKCFEDLVKSVAEDIPIKGKWDNQFIHMDTRLHALQKYLQQKQEKSQEDIVYELVDKNLQDILLSHPNLLSNSTIKNVIDIGCRIMHYVSNLDDEFIRKGYIESNRKPSMAYDYYFRDQISSAVDDD